MGGARAVRDGPGALGRRPRSGPRGSGGRREVGREAARDRGSPRQVGAAPARAPHRTLDLMQALELASLQAFLERHRPDRAEKRLDHLLTRILEEGWTFRQVQLECRKEKERARQAEEAAAGVGQEEDGSGAPRDSAEADAAGRVRAPPPLYRNDERQLLVYIGRLPGATLGQKAELRTLLTAHLDNSH